MDTLGSSQIGGLTMKYKEIQPMMYADLKVNGIYFNIRKALELVNKPYSNSDVKNSLTISRLIKICQKNKIDVKEFESNDISFAMENGANAFDKTSSSMRTVQVISSIDFIKLIKAIKKLPATKNNTNNNYLYEEVAPGIIEETNKRNPEMYWSVQNTLDHIQGFTGNRQYQKLSTRGLTKQINSLFEQQLDDRYKKITVLPSEIYFSDSKLHANNKETYINLSLQDAIFMHYLSDEKVKIANMDRLKELWPSVAKYATQRYKSKTFELSQYDIEAMDKKLKRLRDKAIAFSQDQLKEKDERINHLNTMNLKEATARRQVLDALKEWDNHLPEELDKNSKTTIQLLIDQIENILNIY